MTLRPKSATAPLTGLAGLLGLALTVAMLADRSWPVHLQAMTVIAATTAAMIAVDTAYFQTFRRRSTGLQAKPMRALEVERVVRKLIGFIVTLTTIAAVYWIVPEYRREFYAPYWAALYDTLPALLVGRRSGAPAECHPCSDHLRQSALSPQGVIAMPILAAHRQRPIALEQAGDPGEAGKSLSRFLGRHPAGHGRSAAIHGALVNRPAPPRRPFSQECHCFGNAVDLLHRLSLSAQNPHGRKELQAVHHFLPVDRMRAIEPH
ncbi:hypothetical protein X772_05105 [Mesorhizobium sp. LSJC280B00]|nr:hypothetical protein X772_05105 [Mesorhizobium sp. LSJC280B00]